MLLASLSRTSTQNNRTQESDKVVEKRFKEQFLFNDDKEGRHFESRTLGCRGPSDMKFLFSFDIVSSDLEKSNF